MDNYVSEAINIKAERVSIQAVISNNRWVTLEFKLYKSIYILVISLIKNKPRAINEIGMRILLLACFPHARWDRIHSA